MSMGTEMKKVIVCINHRANPAQPSCGARGGGEELAERLEKEIEAKGLNIRVERFSCLGFCKDGPVLKLSPGGRFVCEATPDKLEELLQEIECFSRHSD